MTKDIQFSRTIAFVIATKDRPNDLKRMLQSLAVQSKKPAEVIIVDSSGDPVDEVLKDFDILKIKYIHHSKPSAAAQRNIGINAVGEGIDLIGFLDDDVVLKEGAMDSMHKFWDSAPGDVAGCSFNLMNFESTGMARLKYSSLARIFGLYSPEKGIVMSSGWQTMIGTVKDTTYVQWLPSTASVWRRSVMEQFRFEEFFEGYSYLEDLDFSYSVSRRYRLAVVAAAGFYHYHSTAGRINRYKFGKIEVANRLFIVKKHDLSIKRCYMALIIRLLMTLVSAVKNVDGTELQRALGNCSGLVQSFFLKNGSSSTASKE